MKKTLFFVLGLACLILNAYAGLTSSKPSVKGNDQIINGQSGEIVATGTINQACHQKIQSIIRSNKLEYFYPSAKLNQVFNRLNLINFESIARKWKIPEEMAYELSTLALYDVVFFVDDSGSMKGPRTLDMKTIVQYITEIMTQFDEDGISVRFMNSNVKGDNLKTANEVERLIDRLSFDSSTPLGRMLKSKVLDPLIINPIQSNTLEKPVLILVITDGEPNPDDKPFFKKNVLDAYKIASSSKYGSKAFGLQITQVGQDSRAEAFLNELDNDPEVGKIIDATSNFEIEDEQFRKKGSDFSYGMWLTKLAVGAIDPFYDNQD
jgi:hypothetical protein